MTNNTQPMAAPADQTARTRALDTTQSFAVTAPAGSGKTGLLTQRVLKLLALCEHPEEVLCITFTRKAAAEMQERIVHALQRAHTQARPEAPHEQLSWDLAQKVLQRDAEKNWQLLCNSNRLRIQTIDGLCKALTQHNPLASGIGGNAKLLDQPVFAYRQAVENTLKQLEDDNDRRLQYDLFVLLRHLDNNLNSISHLLVGLLAKREQWLLPLLQAKAAAREYLETTIDELNVESLNELAALLAPYASDLCLLADYAGHNCQTDKPESSLCQLSGITALPDTSSQAISTWQTISDLLLNQKGDWRSPKGLNKTCGFPAGDKDNKELCKQRKAQMSALLAALQDIPKLKGLLNLARLLPKAQYQHDQWLLLDCLTRILPRAAAELKLVFKQLNATDFTEVTQGALQALGSEDAPTELALVLDYQIKHILVDEFQDTSSPQLHLLEKLTAGWEPQDGRTLFIVGDGMQSCYGFRNANVGIFLDARHHGIGSVALEPLDLTVNFRSQGGVVNWVNDAFQQAFPDSDDIARGAVTYASSTAFKPELNDQAVHFYGISDAENRHTEAQQVRRLVEELLTASADDRVAILVRSRPHLTQVLTALQSAGIQWQATDIDPLASRMAIVDLMTLTKALHDPSDRNAWLALLRTPWIGLDMHDLHSIASMQLDPKREGKTHYPHLLLRLQTQLTSAGITSLSKEAREILARTLPILNTSWQNRRRKSLSYWIQGTWIALGGPTCLTDHSDFANCEDFFRLLDKYDQGSHISDWQEFERAVGQLYAKPASDANPRVQVMTIHKSKGLEFEHVIIPGLDKSARSDEHQLLLWQERINKHGQKRLIMGPLSATGDDTDSLYHFLRQEQKLKNQLETTRLLYVGCTRAIKSLHLLANLKTDEKRGGYKAPSSSSLLASLWPAVENNVSEVNDQADHTGPTEPLAFIRRLKTDWQRPTLVPSSLLAAYRGRDFGKHNDTPDENDNLASSDEYHSRVARLTGTLLHRALQQTTEQQLDWRPEQLEQQRQLWRVQLQQAGIASEQQIQALNKIELGLRRTLDDETGRWLLNAGHAHSECELSLWHTSGQGRFSQIRESIIDRTFVSQGAPDGASEDLTQTAESSVETGSESIRWIIDYKSSEPQAGESLEDFFAREQEAYRDQLMRYQAIFQAEPALCQANIIKTALYFPMLQQLLIVDIAKANEILP